MYLQSGYSGYPDARIDLTPQSWQGMGGLGYTPNLAPVGSAAAGNYYPGDTSGDAAALNYLGFLPDPYLAQHKGTLGSQHADQAASQGAWDSAFRAAVSDFQDTQHLTSDGWIGPKTRSALGAAVNAKNAQNPGPVTPAPGLPAPAPSSPSSPALASSPNYMLYGGIAAAVLALGGLAYYAMK